MSKIRIHHPKNNIAALIAVVLLGLPFASHAGEYEEMQRNKAMTLNLIQALVENGVITQDKADKMIADAEAKAQAAVSALPGPEFKSRYAEAPVAKPQNQVLVAPAPVASGNPAAGAPMQMSSVQSGAAQAAVAAPVVAPSAEQLAAPVMATIPQTNAPDVGPDGKRVVHVAYIPEATKREMREQIKQEVLAQSKAERWGDPGALPDWINRVTISGDIRFRDFYTKLSPTNTLQGEAYSDGLFTRAPDIVGPSFLGSFSTYDTQKSYNNLYLRARLNIDAKVTDQVATGLSLTTGNSTSRTSLSQGLGQNFNNDPVVINRAVIKVDPAPWVSISAGRMNNPFFGTDLLWADDLSFDGIAASFKYKASDSVTPFVTAGYFPLRMDSPGASDPRALVAAQFGVDLDLTKKAKFKLGTGFYDYRNIVGTAETTTSEQTVSDYVSRYEYPAGFRQMGNTLFVINAPDDLNNLNWGLASKFREVDVTGSLDYGFSDAMHLLFVSDYVKNVGYNVHDIFMRTGSTIKDGKNSGYLEKIQVGAPLIRERGNWNVSMLYRQLGSDAVLDAFNNPDFGFGGTNNKGTIFAANLGIYKNTWLTARWLSSDQLQSSIPERSGVTTQPAPTKLSVDMLQIELNARY